MQNIFVEFLPPWIETGNQPAFYDKESGTVLQQTARMYAKVNEVIQSVNNQNETIADYINQFNELHDYVHDYFDNLNVQEEINQKLDNMAMDGSLTLLIKSYIDPIQEEFETEINQTLEQTTTAQNTRITSVEHLVGSAVSGTPLVVSSTDDMTDTNRIYVNSTNGHWYYYDGSVWQDAGTYQATAIDNQSVDTNNLVSPLQTQLNQNIVDVSDELDVLEGYYVSAGGNRNANRNYGLYGPFDAEEGDIITFSAQGESTSICLLGFAQDMNFDAAPYFATPLIASDGNSPVTITHTCEYTGKYFISSKLSYGVPKLFIYKKAVKDDDSYKIKSKFINNIIIDSDTYPETSITPDKYVSYTNGTVNVYASGVYSVTDAIEVTPSSRITLESKVPTFKRGAVDLAGYAFYDKDNHYISGVQMPVNTQSVTMNVPKTAKYVRLTLTKIMLNNGYVLYYTDLFTELKARTEQNVSNEDITKGLCDNCVFIGDSLTVGQYYTSDSTSYENFYNYPYFLKKLMNINNIEEYAKSGATVSSWWTRFADNITAENSIYFVWLGTNSTLTDTIDTDCVGNDYTQYANTETGNFGKILQKINSLNGNKIVLINLFSTVGNLTTNNTVIEKLKDRFNALTVVNMYQTDITDRIYHTASNGYYNKVHFNNRGNNKIAQMIRDTLAKYMETNNIEMFKQKS